MLKKIVLCTTNHSELTPSQFACSSSFRPRREKEMAAKHFTLSVVVGLLLSVGAFAQDVTQCNCTVVVDGVVAGGNISIGTAWMNANGMLWDAAVNGSVGVAEGDMTAGSEDGNPSSESSTGGAGGYGGYSGGDIPITVLSSPQIAGARAAVNIMGGAAAVAGGTAVGGPLAGVNTLLSLFPSLAPGAHCPQCAVRMVTPTGGGGDEFFAGSDPGTRLFFWRNLSNTGWGANRHIPGNHFLTELEDLLTTPGYERQAARAFKGFFDEGLPVQNAIARSPTLVEKFNAMAVRDPRYTIETEPSAWDWYEGHGLYAFPK